MFLVISALGPPPLGAGLAWANPKLFSVFGGSGELASFIISNFLVAGMVPNRISVSWIKAGGLGWGLERFGDVLERSPVRRKLASFFCRFLAPINSVASSRAQG